MRLVGATVVFAILAVGATAPLAAAQLLRQSAIDIRELIDVRKLKAPILRVADRAELRRQLGQARARLKESRCRWAFSPNRVRFGRNCGKIRSRISSLERQLSSARASERRGKARSARGRHNAPSARARYADRTFRTICVRVCDGYYYSLSHTTSRRRFEQDAERCAGQYPPGEAVLFFHPFPGDDVSRARSLDGKRYADQEYAFDFRTAFKPRCAVRLHRGLAALKARVFAAVPTLVGGQPDGVRADGAELAPVALARPHWSSDPETLANRAGRLVPEPIYPPIATDMRIVGDPYYFVEVNPGPPPPVAGYLPPELKDFRVKQHASALEEKRRTQGRSQDVPLGGPY
jgi:hypothetical protein